MTALEVKFYCYITNAIRTLSWSNLRWNEHNAVALARLFMLHNVKELWIGLGQAVIELLHG